MHNNGEGNPGKRVIQKGSDADRVLFDPNLAITLQAENQHSGAPYTLYEGRTCMGRPFFTMQRVRILIEDGALKRRPGEATFLPTPISKEKM